MVWKGPRSPKHIATIAFCDPIFHPLSLLLGRDPRGDRILRSCLQKGAVTTPANYAAVSKKLACKLGVPPWSLFLSKNYRDFEASSLGILVFRGTFRLIWPDFDPVLTNSDLFWPFRWADLAYFHLFRPIRRADLTYFHQFRPISFHNKAPWTGHLM